MLWAIFLIWASALVLHGESQVEETEIVPSLTFIRTTGNIFSDVPSVPPPTPEPIPSNEVTTTFTSTVYITIPANIVTVTVATTFWSTKTEKSTVFSTISSGVATEIVYTTLTIRAKRAVEDAIGTQPAVARDGPHNESSLHARALKTEVKRGNAMAKRADETRWITSTIQDRAVQTITTTNYHTSPTTMVITISSNIYIGASRTTTITSTLTEISSVITETIVSATTDTVAGITYLTTRTTVRDPFMPTTREPPVSTRGAGAGGGGGASGGKKNLGRNQIIGIAAGAGGGLVVIVAIIGVLCIFKKRSDTNRRSGHTAMLAPASPMQQGPNSPAYTSSTVVGAQAAAAAAPAAGGFKNPKSPSDGRLSRNSVPTTMSDRVGTTPPNPHHQEHGRSDSGYSNPVTELYASIPRSNQHGYPRWDPSPAQLDGTPMYHQNLYSEMEAGNGAGTGQAQVGEGPLQGQGQYPNMELHGSLVQGGYDYGRPGEEYHEIGQSGEGEESLGRRSELPGQTRW